jgi:hypothetical protein
LALFSDNLFKSHFERIWLEVVDADYSARLASLQVWRKKILEDIEENYPPFSITLPFFGIYFYSH